MLSVAHTVLNVIELVLYRMKCKCRLVILVLFMGTPSNI